MRLFRELLRRSWRTLVVAAAAGMIGGAGMVAILLLIRMFLIQGGATQLAIGVFAGACLATFAARVGLQLLSVSLSRNAAADLTLRVSRRMLASPLEWLETVGRARLQSVLIRDLPAIAQGLNAVPTICASVPLLVACLVFLGISSVVVFSLVLAVVVLEFFVQALLLRRAQRQIDASFKQQDSLAAQVRRLLEGVKELKLHRPRREAFLADSLRGVVESEKRQGFSIQSQLTLSGSWGRLSMFVVLGIVLIALPKWNYIDRGSSFGYVIAIFIAMRPLETLKHQLPVLLRARNALRRLDRLCLDCESAPETEAIRPWPSDGWRRIELAGVSYRYPGEGGYRLGPLDVAFRRGEVVFLGGDNGSGKTTLVKLITGLYVPESGQIRVDGRPLPALHCETYRQLFSAVFSDSHPFPASLGCDASRSDETIRHWLSELRLDKLVSVEQGRLCFEARLSRGQKARLGLVAALIEDRSFYVLDNWDSSQDPDIKRLVSKRLLPELKSRGKTVLLVSHDDRFRHAADRVMRLEAGTLRQGAAEE